MRVHGDWIILCPRFRAPRVRGVKRMVSDRGLKPWGEILEGIAGGRVSSERQLK
jgi:hypothetical protein